MLLVFAVVLVLMSATLWLAGELTGGMLPANLAVSALTVVCPVLVPVGCGQGREGVRTLLARLWHRPEAGRRVWYLPAVLLLPVLMALGYLAPRQFGHTAPTGSVPVAPLGAVLIALVAVAGAVCEETAWSAYLLDPLRVRWGTATAAVVIGAVWALWHVVPYLQLHPRSWTAWQCLFTVAQRVLIVWVLLNAGSCVPLAAACHASGNVGYLLAPRRRLGLRPGIPRVVHLGRGAAGRRPVRRNVDRAAPAGLTAGSDAVGPVLRVEQQLLDAVTQPYRVDRSQRGPFRPVGGDVALGEVTAVPGVQHPDHPG
jgi:hypothetical protein